MIVKWDLAYIAPPLPAWQQCVSTLRALQSLAYSIPAWLQILCRPMQDVCDVSGLEDDQDEAAPRAERREMRYDDEGLDSEDDFIDDDIGDGTQEHRPKPRGKGRTAGVHNQAVQVCDDMPALLLVSSIFVGLCPQDAVCMLCVRLSGGTNSSVEAVRACAGISQGVCSLPGVCARLVHLKTILTAFCPPHSEFSSSSSSPV